MQAKTLSKVENVHHVLRERILHGKWSVEEVIPTENDLASELGCSRPTVSKAISRLVHEGLVERRKRAGTRVLRNSAQRGRSSVELDAFAFIYPSDKHENFWKIAKGFQQEANLHLRRSLMIPTGADFEKEAEIISRLDEFDIRGAVIYPMISRPEQEVTFFKLLAASKFSLVLIGQPLPGCVCPTVALDGFHLGYTMTKHLIKVGSTRIGFFANSAYEQSRRDMYKGYLWAMEEAGLPLKENWSLLEISMHADFNNPFLEPTALGHTYLKTAEGVEAVVCGDDYLAIGLMHAARERGMRLPEDLKVTGNDDIALGASFDPPLTTYRISAESVGQIAFQTLNNCVSHACPSSLSVPIRGELVIRKSA